MADFEIDPTFIAAISVEVALQRPTSVLIGPSKRYAIDGAVAQVFGLPVHQLECATRGRARAALARQVAMYVTHVSCGMNLTDTGVLFARDRTTVSHACAVIEDLRDDPVFDRVMDLLEWIVAELMSRTGRHQALPV
ncbi:MAG: helix-turn-helix domain-containing protein [Hyphomicrobium sp.]